MAWHTEPTDVRYVAKDDGLGSVHASTEQKVLYRSDTKAPLSVVSMRFQIVQPHDVLKFYRDLTEAGGFKLKTPGVLKEGCKLWALAKTGQRACRKGRDRVNGYLLLGTACDGTLATTAQFASVRGCLQQHPCHCLARRRRRGQSASSQPVRPAGGQAPAWHRGIRLGCFHGTHEGAGRMQE